MAQLKDTLVQGNLRVTDQLICTTALFSILKIPSTSNGTIFNTGTNKQVLRSNGSSIYWDTLYVPASAGTAGSVLVSGGSGNEPIWTDIIAVDTNSASSTYRSIKMGYPGTDYANDTRLLYGKFYINTTGGFIYSGMGIATGNASRNIWFNDDTLAGKPVYNSNFLYNPNTKTLTIGGAASTSTVGANDALIALQSTTTGFAHWKLGISGGIFNLTVGHNGTATLTTHRTVATMGVDGHFSIKPNIAASTTVGSSGLIINTYENFSSAVGDAALELYRGSTASSWLIFNNNSLIFRTNYNGTVYANTYTTEILSLTHEGVSLTKPILSMDESIALLSITNLGGLYTGGKNANTISSNEDLNSYSTPGTYKSPNNTVTDSLSNAPVSGTGFKLYVIRNYTETHRIHLILVENSNRFYIRYGTTANGVLTWTDWERTVNTIMPSDNTTYCVANRLGWSHDNKGHIRFTDHYVDADKISVNKVDPPSENFYVEGTSKFNIGTSDTVADKKFIINGNNRYLSLGGAGIQAYTSTSTGPLYLLFDGGKVEVGKDTTTTTWMQIHGPSATTAFFSSGLVVSHTTNPAIELVRASSGKTNWQIVNEGGTLKMRHNHNGTSAQGSYVTTPISIAYNGTMTITSASSSGTIESTSTLYLSAGTTAAASLIFKGWNGTANDEVGRFNSSGKFIVGKLTSPNSITELLYVEGNGKVNGTFHVTGLLLSGIGTGTGTDGYDYIERASLYNFANYGRALFLGSGNQNTSESLGLIKICCTDSRLKNLIALTQKSTNEIYALIRYDAGDTNFVQTGLWMFFEGSPISSTSESAVGTGYFELYKLPPVDAGLTASVTYDILTTKNHANRLIYYGTCATAATTRAKVVDDIDDFPGLIPGVCIRIKFTNQQNRSVSSTYDTLNVEGTGAKDIRIRGTTGHVRYQWQAGEVLDFVYDGTYWIMLDGGIADTTYYGMTKLYTGAASSSTALALTPSSLYTYANTSIAPYYNANNTYAVGDVVRYSYTNYQCNTAITTAEAWNDAHWTALEPLQVQMMNHVHDTLTRMTDTRSASTQPNDYNNKIIFKGLKQNSVIGLPSTDPYSYVIGLRGWTDDSGGHSQEFAFNNSGIFLRVGATTSWESWKRIWRQGDAVTGAVWNDYAEYRASNCTEPGYVVMEKGNDTLIKTSERLSHFAGVTSDTWGFAQGETEEAKTPIAVAGRVLVYTYKDRNSYKPGDVVCAAPNGTVDIMTREEVINFPDRIVGTVSCVPDYEEWGGGKGADRDPVKINNRIWIKVK